jgi:NitT/TauT family transport system permease protein
MIQVHDDEAKPAQKARRRPIRYGLILTQLGILVLLLAGWQFGVADKNVAYFSRPMLVGDRLVELLTGHDIYRDIRVTLTEVAIGYGCGAIAGIVMGFVLGRFKFLSDAMQPYIIALYSIPQIALAPLFIVWFGLGIESKIAVVSVMTFFLVFFSAYSGFVGANEELIRLARLMGASWYQVVRRVLLPNAAHQIFIGLKSAVPYAVIGAVIGEYIGANEGLGHFILYSSQTYDAPGLFSGIAILVVIVFAVNAGLNRLERRLMRWKQTPESSIKASVRIRAAA